MYVCMCAFMFIWSVVCVYVCMVCMCVCVVCTFERGVCASVETYVYLSLNIRQPALTNATQTCLACGEKIEPTGAFSFKIYHQYK
jgi:hypothetical protein